MKKWILVFLVTVLAFGFANAQVTINSSDFPKIGYKANRMEHDTVGLQFMKDMLNKDTFDLRGIPAGKPGGMVEVIDPLKTVDTNRFPMVKGSNTGFKSVLVWKFGPNTITHTQVYGMLLNTAGLWFKGGYWASTPDTIIPGQLEADTAEFKFARSGLFLQFPMSKGTKWKDTTLQITNDTTGGHLVTKALEMNEELTMTNAEVLSEVTLILPDSTVYKNGLLVKKHDLNYETTWYVNKDSIEVERDTSFDSSYQVIFKKFGGVLDFDFDEDNAQLSFSTPAGPQSVTNALKNEISGQFTVSNNYPNPFNPTTNFSFHLPKSENVLVRILNIRGQTVREVVNRVLPSGSFDVQLDMANFASGTYFYEVKTPSHRTVKRMVLLK